MKGLEISEVQYGELNAELRLDAEYHTGLSSRYRRMLDKTECTFIVDECRKAVKGIFDVKSDWFVTDGVPFVNISGLRDWRLDPAQLRYISKEISEQNKASQLLRGDIAISKTAIPAASIVTTPVCNVSQDVIAVSLKTDSRLDSYYLVAYLNSRYGLFLMENLFTGNIQKHFNLNDCKTRLPIPVFRKDGLQKEIHELVERAFGAQEEAAISYLEAEQILLDELGFAGWSPTDDTVSVKSYSDFVSAGRFDAEYFQPKYDDYFKMIARYRNGHKRLGDLTIQNVSQCDKTFPEYDYIEIGDVNVGNATYCSNRLSVGDLPANAKIMAHKGDLIISKVRPNRGAVAIIEDERSDLVVSGAFTVVAPKDEILRECLLVLLRTNVYRDWLLRWAVGSSYPVVKDEDVLNVPIPLIDTDIQQKIAAKVQSSFTLRAESKRLLDLAKHVVETAIEHGEERAMRTMEGR